MNDYYEKYKDNPEMLVARADREGNLELLKEIFFNKKRLDILLVSEKEKWNSLHGALVLCGADYPPQKVIQFYIDNGVEINGQDIYGMTPLHYAMRGKNVEAAIALLNAGADPNIPNIDNLIPLRMCIRYPDRLDLLELMLKNGGDVHYFNGQDYLLEGLKDFKGNDPNYASFFEMLEKYA